MVYDNFAQIYKSSRRDDDPRSTRSIRARLHAGKRIALLRCSEVPLLSRLASRRTALFICSRVVVRGEPNNTSSFPSSSPSPARALLSEKPRYFIHDFHGNYYVRFYRNLMAPGYAKAVTQKTTFCKYLGVSKRLQLRLLPRNVSRKMAIIMPQL